MDTIFELKDIYFYSEDFEILTDINLTIPKGKCTIIMGSSGCGKSTLLKVIAGIYPPDLGKMYLEGKNFLNFSYKELTEFRKKSGFVFQDSALWENTTIYDNIALPLKFHFRNLTDDQIKEKILYLINYIGFTDSIRLRPARLSVGEQKVISYIRATISDPEILFMDEPVQAMDNQFTKKIMQLLRTMKEKGNTLVAVSQDTNLVSLLADYLVIVRKGRIVIEGDFNIVKQSNEPYVKDILSKVLGEAASFDTELLDLLNE
ncbi:MAG: ATP-binding cassette domain-containing protein [Spirochaetales bacterium]|nr:ATP-binding cassette domain-containing protein [Spirochaetales bacterium]